MAERPLFVVLGASNVQLGLPQLVEELAARSGAPFDLLLAHGHGRSYGRASRYLARELPAIRDCGLWPALAAATDRPVYAVLADIGNDIVYGAQPAEIAAWVEECRARLAERAARITLVGLPEGRIAQLSPLGFQLVRQVFFPRHRIARARALENARELGQRLGALTGTPFYVRPPAAWYGLDPIHVRRSARRAAWSAILEPLLAAHAGPRPGLTRAEQAALARIRPAQRRLFGRLEQRTQPQARLADGSCVSWY